MCGNFYDIRTFGAVMTHRLQRRPGARPGAVRLRPLDRAHRALEISITRMAATNETDVDKERTMGRKHIVPYGLYRATASSRPSSPRRPASPTTIWTSLEALQTCSSTTARPRAARWRPAADRLPARDRSATRRRTSCSTGCKVTRRDTDEPRPPGAVRPTTA